MDLLRTELRRQVIDLDLSPTARHRALFLLESLCITLTREELNGLLELMEVLT
jgi:hypothetical protein